MFAHSIQRKKWNQCFGNNPTSSNQKKAWDKSNIFIPKKIINHCAIMYIRLHCWNKINGNATFGKYSKQVVVRQLCTSNYITFFLETIFLVLDIPKKNLANNFWRIYSAIYNLSTVFHPFGFVECKALPTVLRS